MTVALAGNVIDVDGVLMVRGVLNDPRTKGTICRRWINRKVSYVAMDYH